jgi:amino acid transporter
MTRGRSRLLVATVVALVLGLALMLPFEYTVTRLLGMIALATFVVLGLRLVADPAFLERDRAEG